MKTSVIQFGTSRFLQAHADLMVFQGSDHHITVVETTGSTASRDRIEAINKTASFPVILRGLSNGQQIDTRIDVSSVTRGLSAREQYAELRRIFIDEADYVISNTGDRGFELPTETDISPTGWTCYPELLTLLLHERFRKHGRPLTLLPSELVSRNGSVLRDIVMGLAADHGLGTLFSQWLKTECLWMNSLVDRIVSEPIEPIGAVAEPYALWAIEKQSGFVPPARHPDLVIVDDLAAVERKKLYILNLAHTLLAEKWQAENRPATETVREILNDQHVLDWVSEIMETEVIPAFGADKDAAHDYWKTCLERFCNPFLAHRLADIAQNHAAKVERRIGGLMDWKKECRFERLRAAVPLISSRETA